MAVIFSKQKAKLKEEILEYSLLNKQN